MGIGNLGMGQSGMGHTGSPFGLDGPGHATHSEPSDALEVYFECITTCSLDDGACVTRCVEQLREHP